MFKEGTNPNIDLFNFYKAPYEILMVITFSTPTAGTYKMWLSRWEFAWTSNNTRVGILVYFDPFCGGDIENNRNSNILYASSLHWAKQNQSLCMAWDWSHFELLHSYIHCSLKRRLLSHLIIRVWSSQSQPFAGKTCKTYMFCYCREHFIVWVSIDSFGSTAAAV